MLGHFPNDSVTIFWHTQRMPDEQSMIARCASRASCPHVVSILFAVANKCCGTSSMRLHRC